MTDTITTICTTLLTLMGGTASVVWFYNSKKRTEAAKASQAEADAISKYADEWRELYKQKDKEVADLNKKVDALYDNINELRRELFDIREQLNKEKLERQSAEYFKCVRHGCKDRIPPNENI